MRNQLLFISLIIALLGQVSAFAQVDGKKSDAVRIGPIKVDSSKIQKQIKELKRRKNAYEAGVRKELADKIAEINQKLDQDSNYTKDEAEADKMELATMFAEKIRRHNDMIEKQIAFAEVKGFNAGEMDDQEVIKFNTLGFEVRVPKDDPVDRRKNIKTTSMLAMGFGYNFMDGQNLDINDFSYANNNYFSLAFMLQTALNKSQKLRLNYGIQYQTHGTELNGDRIFSPNTDQTEIINLGFQPKKAKFRQDQFVVPVQLEFGGTTKKEYEDGRVRYEQWDKWKFGIGGFAGFNTSSRLKIKRNENGREIKETIVNAFDNEAFVYGVDAYVGRDQVVAFARMNLNDVFKSGSVDGQYISFGLRLQ